MEPGEIAEKVYTLNAFDMYMAFDMYGTPEDVKEGLKIP